MSARRHRARTVRFRVTAVATLVFGLALGLASTAFVVALQGSLRSDAASAVATRLSDAADAIETGTSIEDVISDSAASGIWITVVDTDGTVVGNATVDTVPFAEVRRTDEPVTESTDGQVTAVLEVNTPRGPITMITNASLEPVDSTIRAVVIALVIGTPFLAAMVAVLMWLLTGRALRPVERVRSEVDEITQSTLDRRVVEPGTGDEIDRLAHTMNGMLDRLESADRVQRRFVADAAHELRTPLATNRARLERALSTPATTDWQAVSGQVLDTEERLTRLVDDLLELSRAETDDPSGSHANLVAIVEQAVEAQQEVAAHAPDLLGHPEGMVVESHTAPLDEASVAGEYREIERLVRNLLDNAARHGGGRVRVRLSATDPDRVQLVVEDNGPGIPVERRDEVFERFTRLDASRSRSNGGTGLGLAIVDAAARRHNATIEIDDSPELGGARFTVAFRRITPAET